MLNQVPPLVGYNPFDCDAALREALHREGGGFAEAEARALGARVWHGSRCSRWGFEANEVPPAAEDPRPLRPPGRRGRVPPGLARPDEVAVEPGLHSCPGSAPRPGAHVARGAAVHVLSQAEAGHGCPISMTYAAVPALRTQPELAAAWEPRFLSAAYDQRTLPAADKPAPSPAWR